MVSIKMFTFLPSYVKHFPRIAGLQYIFSESVLSFGDMHLNSNLLYAVHLTHIAE
jgi:hypothetical protein